MGAFDLVPNITIPDPDNTEAAAAFRKKWRWEAHEQVIIKGQFTAADQEATQNVGSDFKANGQQNGAEMRMGSARRKLLEVMIIDWTLTAGGRKVSVSPEMIKRLPSNYTIPILEKCDEIAVGMTLEDQESFLDSANGHTAVDFAETKLSRLPS